MKQLIQLLAATSCLALVGCGSPESGGAPDAADEAVTDRATPPTEQAPADTDSASVTPMDDVEANAERLQNALDTQPEEVKARYDARHPGQTLAFFGIEPGMTVAEALPGGGWYSKILLPYLGPDGKLVGAHYPDSLWPVIMPDAEDETIARYIERGDGWIEQAAEWTDEESAGIDSYKMTNAPAGMTGQVDAALFIRALHNLHRAGEEAGYLTAAIEETHDLVKPGGLVGVVQHRAGEDRPDDWADGSAGYLKQSAIVAAFEDAGFIFEEASEINANPDDTAGPGDIVWRLPPSLATTEEDTPEYEAMKAIGESDRMTLRFRKPE
jgi:predicted methyltransferase